MPYCITLRSRTERRITGWYDGSDSRWSTDHRRQKIFDRKRDAKPVCHELRKLCPNNANLINIEPRRAIFDMQSWVLWVLTLPAVLVARGPALPVICGSARSISAARYWVPAGSIDNLRAPSFRHDCSAPSVAARRMSPSTSPAWN